MNRSIDSRPFDSSRPAPPELSALYAELIQQKTDRELELLAILLPDPAAGVVAATNCGIRAESIDADDLRLIFCGCLAVAGRKPDLPFLIRILRRALAEAGFWDAAESRAFHRGSLWSDPCLADFALSFAAGPSRRTGPAVAEVAATLIDINSRIADGKTYYRYALARLEGRAA